MTLEILGREISRVAIIDDQPEVRQSYGYTVQNADLVPVSENGPLRGSVSDYLRNSTVTQGADVGLCDFQLGARAYASFSGAELVESMYKQNFPAVLCTRFEKAEILRITPHRRWIPVLLKPAELTEESLIDGIRECINELSGEFRITRRPWRTQIHFLSQDEDYPGTFFVEVPGWEVDEVLKVRLTDLPEDIRGSVVADFRCYAKVNLGAESFADIYFYDWEVP